MELALARMSCAAPRTGRTWTIVGGFPSRAATGIDPTGSPPAVDFQVIESRGQQGVRLGIGKRKARRPVLHDIGHQAGHQLVHRERAAAASEHRAGQAENVEHVRGGASPFELEPRRQQRRAGKMRTHEVEPGHGLAVDRRVMARALRVHDDGIAARNLDGGRHAVSIAARNQELLKYRLGPDFLLGQDIAVGDEPGVRACHQALRSNLVGKRWNARAPLVELGRRDDPAGECLAARGDQDGILGPGETRKIHQDASPQFGEDGRLVDLIDKLVG